MLRLVKHLVIALVVIIAAGCGGGGCSGCSCGGMTPLPGGFDPARRVENAASVRLTDSGLGFLRDNLSTLAATLLGNGMGGGLSFAIPPTQDSFLGVEFDVCPAGSTAEQCQLEIDLANANLNIATAGPHNVTVTGTIPVILRDLPIHITYFCIPGIGCVDSDIGVTLLGNPGDSSCPARFDDGGGAQNYATINIDAQISIEIDADTSHARYGYSRVRINQLFNEDQLNDQIADQATFCGGFDAGILDALSGFVLPLLTGGLFDTLTGSIEEQLCQPADPSVSPSCPVGTTDVDGICRYGATEDAECASIILGIEGNFDLGGLLAGFSPGAKGAFDFVFGAGGHSVRADGSGHHYGDLDPIGGGATLALYGGTDPTPASGCVPLAEVALPSGIPIPDEMLANTVPNWPAATPGPHFGLAVSETFTNYMMAQLYNSGALCLGITADALGPSVPLQTSLVGVALGANSLTELGRLGQPAPLAITLRPQSPPVVEFGNGTDALSDPLVHIGLNQLSFDFYAWSLDRYIRAFTATMDLSIPLNLVVTPEGLVPAIQEIGVANATVSNAVLLREDPAAVATALQGLLGELVGGFLGDAFPPVDFNSSLVDLGLRLEIPPTVEGEGSPGLRKVTKGSEDFLGIFATLGLAMAPATSLPLEAPDGAPLAVASPNAALDQSAEPVADTTVEVMAVDIDPVGLSVEGYDADNGPRVSLAFGSSIVDGTRPIEWQYKLNRGPWRPFTRERYVDLHDEWLRTQGKHVIYVRSRIAGDTYSLDPTPAAVEVVVDIDPPVIQVTEGTAGQVLVRVRDAVSGVEGSEVRVRFLRDTSDEEPWSTWMRADALMELWPDGADAVEVEARDEEGLVGTATHALLRGRAEAAGCDCNLAEPSSRDGLGWLAAALAAIAALGRRSRTRHSRPARVRHAALALAVLLPGMWGCSCGDVTDPGATCRLRGDCLVVRPGLIGAYTSAARAPEGTIWVAGYLEANWTDTRMFGDLVVGRMSNGLVDWQAVDGVPVEPPVDPNVYDPLGFRGGQTEAGDDVGLWTSIAIDGSAMPGVAYYDASGRALRYAHFDGTTWSKTVVQRIDRGDIGRYAKLVYQSGVPVIAYLFIEPGSDGAVRSGVRLAVGASVDAATSWSFEDVAVNEASPCQDLFCGAGTACVADTGLCADTRDDCAEECGSGQECIDNAGAAECADVRGANALATYPDATGLYIDAAVRPDGSLGIAFYDRPAGNVVVATRGPDGWLPVIVDGETGGTDSGDKGIGLSLAIDAQDNFHLAYVDGLSEGLNYQMVAAGGTAGTVEVVDNGILEDGQHLVGDDSHILVTASGEVRISYQDATAGQLRYAVGTPAATAHEWTTRAVEQEGFAGFFSQQIDTGGAIQILNWWRTASPEAVGDVRVVAP
jgi:hypothetical protein